MTYSSKLSSHYLELAEQPISKDVFAGEDVRFSSEYEALENELAKYQEALESDTGLGDLRERPRVIILNKADVPEAEELAEFVKDDLKEKQIKK